jgi:hypothetical protein
MFSYKALIVIAIKPNREQNLKNPEDDVQDSGLLGSGLDHRPEF